MLKGTESPDFYFRFVFPYNSISPCPFFGNSRKCSFSDNNALPRCRWLQWQIYIYPDHIGLGYTGGKFATGSHTWQPNQTFSREYLRKFSKIRNFVFTLGYSGARVRWFMQETRSKKSRDTVPLITFPTANNIRLTVFFLVKICLPIYYEKVLA